MRRAMAATGKMATAALAWTDRVQVGIGLAPVPLRNVALLAMEVATVHRLFPGRFLPGSGFTLDARCAQAACSPAVSPRGVRIAPSP